MVDLIKLFWSKFTFTLLEARPFYKHKQYLCIAMKRSRLQNRVSKFMPKKVWCDWPHVLLNEAIYLTLSDLAKQNLTHLTILYPIIWLIDHLYPHTGRLNDKLTKWQVDQRMHWLNDKLTKWQADQMTHWLNDKLVK